MISVIISAMCVCVSVGSTKVLLLDQQTVLVCCSEDREEVGLLDRGRFAGNYAHILRAILASYNIYIYPAT